MTQMAWESDGILGPITTHEYTLELRDADTLWKRGQNLEKCDAIGISSYLHVPFPPLIPFRCTAIKQSLAVTTLPLGETDRERGGGEIEMSGIHPPS